MVGYDVVVDSTIPSYSYKAAKVQSSRPVQEASPARTQQSNTRPHNSSSSTSSRNNNTNNNRNKNNSNSNDNSNDKNSNKNNTNVSNQRSSQPSQRVGNKLQAPAHSLALHERVTIVPSGLAGSSSAPLNSLVISGSNLTPEELAALTQSLQSSLRFPDSSSSSSSLNNSNNNNNNQGVSLNGDQSNFPADIFAGGAVWTNSNTPQAQNDWQSPTLDGNPNPQQQSQNEHSAVNTPASDPVSNNNANYSQYNGKFLAVTCGKVADEVTGGRRRKVYRT